MPIKCIYGRQIFDSRGEPTVEVDMVTELGLFRVSVPSTDLKKSAEAVQLRDHIPEEYHGMGVSMAVQNINTIIGPEIIKHKYEVTMQKEIDELMIHLDGTDNKSKLGANAIMAVSMVVAKAGASKKGMPLYQHIAEMAGVTSYIIPVPHIVILNGGILSGNGLAFQEYGVMPTGATSFAEAMRIGSDIYTYVKNAVKEKYGINYIYVGDNGGFSVPLASNRDALMFLSDAIKECDYVGKAEIFINCSAMDFLIDGAYDVNFKNPNSNSQDYLSGGELRELYLTSMKEFGVISVEDPFDVEDFSLWIGLTSQTQGQVLGNDLTQSNLNKINMAIAKKAGTSIALRINQSGTVTELIEAYKLIRESGMGCVLIDRWGDTEDLFLADLVIGLSAGQLKSGAPTRCERIAKYNQIMRLEEELRASAQYAGKAYRSIGKAEK